MTTTTSPATSPSVGSHDWAPYAAVIAGTALLMKAVLIIGSGNDIADGLTGTLYLGGLLVALAAAIGAGLRSRRGRRTVVGVGCVVLLLAYVMMLSDGVGELFAMTSDAPWVADEGPVGVLGVVLLLLGARARSTDTT